MGETDRGNPGGAFIIRLLLEEPCALPPQQFMQDVMERHFNQVPCVSYSDGLASFAPLQYRLAYEGDKTVPPQLLILKCIEISEPVLDELELTQLWDGTEGRQILERCRYQLVASDLLGTGLESKERAQMLVDFIEALAEMFPSCRAFVFENSKKLRTRADILNCELPKAERFIHYAVNTRFFRIEGTEDMLVDTLGMSALFLPDLQYHFHGLEPRAVVDHARGLLSYLLRQENEIQSGDWIDGLSKGRLSRDVPWRLQYEDALLPPEREVIDVNPGEYASGQRHKEEETEPF